MVEIDDPAKIICGAQELSFTRVSVDITGSLYQIAQISLGLVVAACVVLPDCWKVMVVKDLTATFRPRIVGSPAVTGILTCVDNCDS